MAKKTYEQYREEIYYLDTCIANTHDTDKKIELINKNIQLNKEYIHLLKRVIPVKIVFCVILSFAFLIGLMIFLPQIIIRKNRVAACERRINNLTAIKNELLSEKEINPLS